MDLFSIPVHKASLTGTEKEIKDTWDLLNDIWDECSPGQFSGETGKSTAEKTMYLHECPEMQWIIDQMMPSVIEYWDKQLNFMPAAIAPTHSWANLHNDGDYTKEHSHSAGPRQAHVASVFYLKKQEGGDIEFCNPLDYIHRLTPLRDPVDDAILSHKVDCLTGDFLLFPGWLRHRTSPANGKRVAISVNYYGRVLD